MRRASTSKTSRFSVLDRAKRVNQQPAAQHLTQQPQDSEDVEDSGPRSHTRSVLRLLKESDQETEIQEQQRQHESTRERSETGVTRFNPQSAPSPSVRQGTRNARHPRRTTAPSAEERRVLGVAEKTPLDAIRVYPPNECPDPSELVPMPATGRSRFKLLRPINTLGDEQLPTSARSQYYARKTGRGEITERVRYDLENHEDFHGRANNHVIPHKRQRVESASPKPTIVPSVTRSLASTKIGTSERTHSAHGKNATKEVNSQATDDRRASSLDQSSTRAAEHMREGPVQARSPLEELCGTTAIELDTKSDGFSRSRVFKPSTTSSDEGELPYKLVQLPEFSKLRSPVLTDDGSRSRKLAVADDSPDELQIDQNTMPGEGSGPTRAFWSARNGHSRLHTKVDASYKKGSRTYELLSAFPRALKGSMTYQLEANFAGDPWPFSICVKRPTLGTDPLLVGKLSRLQRLVCAEDNQRLILWFASGTLDRNQLALEFCEAGDSVKFVEAAQKYVPGLKIASVEPSKLERMARKMVQDMTEDMSRPDSTPVTHSPLVLNAVSPRAKRTVATGNIGSRLVDRLDAPSLRESSRSTSAASGEGLRGSYTNNAHAATLISKPGDLNITRRARLDTVVEPSHEALPVRHSTQQQQQSSKEKTLQSQSIRPQIRDLVDPWDGKTLKLTVTAPTRKTETLNQDDLERLNEEEFLNDNLISFFLLYLQKIADEQQLKRMHFFNTFFFTALAKDQKGRSTINYDAVKRWTKNVNLFTRDFVIVPVNENYHWFVMIICNLPCLKQDESILDEDVRISRKTSTPDILLDESMASNSKPIQQQRVAQSPENKVILVSDVAPESVATTSFQDLSLEDETPTVSHVSRQERVRHSKRRIGRQQKYDVQKPVIITLDSLDQAHSTTASSLKKYIAALAADNDQHGGVFDVDPNSIPGMTAKGIPHQNNFSDCGLYLCMYMEQFMADPSSFVRNILQRQDGQGWPRQITSRNLRERLAHLIDQLYKKQQDASYEASLAPLGSILTDMVRDPVDAKHETVDIIEHSRVNGAKERWLRRKSSQSRAEIIDLPFTTSEQPDAQDVTQAGNHESSTRRGTNKERPSYPAKGMQGTKHDPSWLDPLARPLRAGSTKSKSGAFKSHYFDVETSPDAPSSSLEELTNSDNAQQMSEQARHLRRRNIPLRTYPASSAHSGSSNEIQADRPSRKRSFKDAMLRTPQRAGSPQADRTTHRNQPRTTYIEVVATDDEQ